MQSFYLMRLDYFGSVKRLQVSRETAAMNTSLATLYTSVRSGILVMQYEQARQLLNNRNDELRAHDAL